MIDMYDFDYERDYVHSTKKNEEEEEKEDKKVCNCGLFKKLHFVLKTSLLALSALGIVFILKKISFLDGGPDL